MSFVNKIKGWGQKGGADHGALDGDVTLTSVRVSGADGDLVLLDFGAARRSVAGMSGALTGIVKAGYSPQEQYATDGRLQGPWSDFYALGGTLYRIHGTNEPWKLGGGVSSGCIRLSNDDIVDLYNRTRVGATVVVQ